MICFLQYLKDIVNHRRLFFLVVGGEKSVSCTKYCRSRVSVPKTLLNLLLAISFEETQNPMLKKLLPSLVIIGARDLNFQG